MRAHARKRLKCRIRDRGRLWFRWRVPEQGSVRVTVGYLEAPDGKPTSGQWSPRRAELRAHGTESGFDFRYQSHTRRLAPGRGGLRNPLGQLQPGLGNDMMSFQVACGVNLHRFCTPGVWCCQTLELGPRGERALVRVRVWTRDIGKCRHNSSLVISLKG